MAHIKTLYISDLDGTLLNSQSQLSSNTVRRLNRLIKDKGILFTIATARTPATVANLMQQVETPLPYIVMAGAALWENADQKYEEVQTINNAIVDEILQVYASHSVNPFIYRQHGNCIYAHHVPDMTTEERDFINFRLTSPLKQLFIDQKLQADDEDQAMLIYAMGEFNELRTIADEIEMKAIPCTLMCYHDIFNAARGYLEIYAQGTTKAAAIQHLASQTGAERVVVFGDNLNDIPMMKTADYSVAVGNAFQEVKVEANEVIGTNDEDAVVNWIEKDLSRNDL